MRLLRLMHADGVLIPRSRRKEEDEIWSFDHAWFIPRVYGANIDLVSTGNSQWEEMKRKKGAKMQVYFGIQMWTYRRWLVTLRTNRLTHFWLKIGSDFLWILGNSIFTKSCLEFMILRFLIYSTCVNKQVSILLIIMFLNS